MTSRAQIHPVDLRIGERLRDRRRQRGWSQEALAHAIGVSLPQIRKYEQGLNRLSSSKLYAAARALDVGLDDLFEGLSPPVRLAEAPAIAALLADEDGAGIALSLTQLSARDRKRILDVLKLLCS